MPTATAADTAQLLAPERSEDAWLDRLARRARRRVPAASTTAFRIAFGLLVAWSSARVVWRGWVGRFYLAPEHHLTYARFEWVRPLPAPLMYAHVVLLGVLGLAIAAGWRTRSCAALFAIGFAYLELIDAALYLNHYWLMTLLAVLLAVVPRPSADRTVPAITVWALRGQLAVVYVFAGIAKLNSDWLLHAEPLRIWLAARTDRPIVGPWLDEQWVAFAFSWAGVAFDLTIVGWLLWRRSRPFAYATVVGFHVATAALFQIGLFPWMMIALTPIFFSPSWCQTPLAVSDSGRRVALVGRSQTRRAESDTGWSRARVGVVVLLAAVNVVLPLRHYVAPGEVGFNDDGYYLAWHVMVVERAGFVKFEVTDPATGVSEWVWPDDVLDEWQVSQATSRPDLILATAHVIAHDHAQPVEVRADAWVSLNGRTRQRWIDPDVDLATVSRTAPADTYVLPLDPPVRR